MTRRRECATSCCTTPTCEIGSHAFGTDGSGVPTGWTLRDGAFDVVGGFLSCTTSNSLALFSTPHPDGIASAIVEVEVYFAGNEQEIIVFDHDGSDDDNFYYVLVELYFLSLYRMNGGTPELLRCVRADNTAGPATITAYFDGETSGMFAATNGTQSVWTDVGTGHAGTYVGLGTRTIDSQADFDNFVATKYKQPDNDCEEFVPDDCEDSSDTFGSPDDGDLGCPWTEISGTALIDTGKLSFTANSSRARFNNSLPTGKMSVTVDVTGSANGNVAEIGVGANSATTTRYYARLTTGPTGTLVLGSAAGGTLATLSSVATTAGATYELTVTLSTNRLCVSMSDNSGARYLSTPATPPSGTSYATLGAPTVSGSVKFDDFILSKAYDEDDAPTCEQCAATGSTCSDCCPEGHTQMIVDIGPGLTDKATCHWCSLVDGEFTLTGGGCVFNYCMHATNAGDGCCDTYECDRDCDDGFGAIPCTGDGTAGGINCTGVYIAADIRVDSNSLCYLRVTVYVVNSLPVDEVTECGAVTTPALAAAIYESERGAGVSPCSGELYTLYKITASTDCDGDTERPGAVWPAFKDGCNGDWPDTITIRSAP